jgi:hypothetical protein
MTAFIFCLPPDYDELSFSGWSSEWQNPSAYREKCFGKALSLIVSLLGIPAAAAVYCSLA